MKNVRMTMVVTVNAEMEMALISEVAEKEFQQKLADEEYNRERDAFFEELRACHDEDERIRKDLREWLRTHDSSDPEYSDIYKDVYGVRPRW